MKRLSRELRSRSSILSQLTVAFVLFFEMGLPVCLGQNKAAIDGSVRDVVRGFFLLDAAYKPLADKASGVLIFPHVTKGGMALASEFGEGVLQINGVTVGYYSITSVSVGITAGMAVHSEILMFMTDMSLEKFRKSRGWSIGANNDLALISKGVTGDYDSNTLQKPILAFVFGQTGLIADVSVEGSKITRIRK